MYNKQYRENQKKRAAQNERLELVANKVVKLFREEKLFFHEAHEVLGMVGDELRESSETRRV